METAEKYMEIVRALTKAYDEFYDYIFESTVLTKSEKDAVIEEYIQKFVDLMRLKNES